MNQAQLDLQKKIIKSLKVQPKIDAKIELRRSIDLIKEFMKKNQWAKSLVLGISGGQDSTLAGKIAQIAIDELRQETGNNNYKFIAVRLPYGEQADESDAMDAIEFMKADLVKRVNIKAATDDMIKAVSDNHDEISDFNKGNIKARQRMIAQYAIASANGGVVIGTDHAAEAVTGFYTKFGDGAADITPLWRLDKRQGVLLLKLLNAPEHLYKKIPTADLEDDRPALPDEKALGVTYDEIDDFLEGNVIDEKAATIIEKWYLKTEHKRKSPITVFDDFWK
ncbi:ammonia-dependent NAD(+) synthetase [Lactobacillus sp. S2-2]|uniref:ammonia-dependent NAD(+) synthetase n=1 Tax=Lactobacillus sp. S2-2 TaxID=2692917 RepID=UPI001F007604|nr:ammonia-dependent NAD(+) synthetase [Lactobacillus sp. S2-2]MCF6515625.1 ammonia-dependent NAD(+) synthetase [Lactobacillus sp. S2-2]